MIFVVSLFLASGTVTDWKDESERWQNMRSVCMGAVESSMTADKACVERDKLTKRLQKAGYCFDKSEFEWSRCKAKRP